MPKNRKSWRKKRRGDVRKNAEAEKPKKSERTGAPKQHRWFDFHVSAETRTACAK